MCIGCPRFGWIQLDLSCLQVILVDLHGCLWHGSGASRTNLCTTAGGWGLEAGGGRLEAGGWRPGAGAWGLESVGWRLEAGGWRLGARGRKTETNDLTRSTLREATSCC